MNYRELQTKLKFYKEQGLTEIKLNSSREELETELEQLTVAKISDATTETINNEEVETVVENAIASEPTCPGCHGKGIQWKSYWGDWGEKLERLTNCSTCWGTGVPKPQSTMECRHRWDGELNQWVVETVVEEIAIMDEENAISPVGVSEVMEVAIASELSSDPLQQNFPCWLNARQTAQAKALCEELGFWSIGSIDNWGEPDPDLFISSWKDWKFYYPYQEFEYIEAHCKGAIFNFYLEDADKTDCEKLVRKAKAVLKRSTENWGEQFGIQLNLFEPLDQVRSPPASGRECA